MNTLQAGGAEGRSVSTKARAVEAIYAAGHYLLSQERPRDAAKAFRLMLRVAPQDERGWLGLGQCHEKALQPHVACELYGAGSVVTANAGAASVRCLLARARILKALGRDPDDALQVADEVAYERDDEELIALVSNERRRLS
jgi:hypothetical protein